MRVGVSPFRMVFQRRLLIDPRPPAQRHHAIHTERAYKNHPGLSCWNAVVGLQRFEQIASYNHRIGEKLCRRSFHSCREMEDKRNIRHRSSAVGTRPQIPITQIQLRSGMRLRHLQKPFSLAPLAKKTPNFRIAVDEKALDNMNSDKAARSGHQDFQALTSG
jgi:hypothetical protein